jgi:hypothetical protein
LADPAERAVRFIVESQHEEGGWRYFPKQSGDTTVTGWQLMALQSAQLAGLDVPADTLERVDRFLDTKQDPSGSYYGYMRPGQSPTPTAVGLLSRMYLGWNQFDPRILQGVHYLYQMGPSQSDMYFNYYATQVLHHLSADGWPAWNRQLRDYLIRLQETEGHEQGSWFRRDPHNEVGGRLYTTAICAMTLEVYYRYMPLYGPWSVDSDL